MHDDIDQATNLNCIMAALHYLSREAEGTGALFASCIIRKAIAEIVLVGKSNGEHLDTHLTYANQKTCSVLEFFDCYVRANPAARASFLRSLTEGVGSA